MNCLYSKLESVWPCENESLHSPSFYYQTFLCQTSSKILKVWLEFSVHLVSCFVLFLCWNLFFFNYAEKTYFLVINSYSPPVASFCSLLLLHVKLLSSGISRIVGLELRVYEHTVPGVVPAATSFPCLYVNFVLSLFGCNFFPVLVLFFGAIQSLFWFVLKLFLIKFESILYS